MDLQQLHPSRAHLSSGCDSGDSTAETTQLLCLRTGMGTSLKLVRVSSFYSLDDPLKL